MRDLVVSAVVGLAVFLLWSFGVLDVVWMRDAMGIALGISLGGNGAMVTWLALQSKSTTEESQQLVHQ